MSPITAAARERLEHDVLQWLTPVSAPTVLPVARTLLRHLVDDVIAAVRAEQPGDNKF